MPLGRLLLAVIAGCVLLAVFSACDTNPKESFDLEHPPEGWQRYTDHGALSYTIWVPGDWRIFRAPPGDFRFPTTYEPPGGGEMGVVGVDFIEPIDFRKDPRDPLVQSRDVFPESTYVLTVGNLSIPCARYVWDTKGVIPHLVATREALGQQVNHVCVVGPHAGNFYALGLSTYDCWEAQLEPTWRLIVMGFALEQPPP